VRPNPGNFPARILVVKTHALGDVLMITPALKALRKHYPDATIDFLVGKWSAPALSGNPAITNLITVEDSIFHERKSGSLLKLIKKLRRSRYDLAIIFQPSIIMHLLVRLAGVGKIAAPVNGFSFGLVKFPSSWRVDRNTYVVEDFLDVVRGIGIEAQDISMEFYPDEESRSAALKLLDKYELQKGRFLMVFPGGGRNPRDFVAQKQWPPDRYRQIIEKADSADMRVVLAGSAKDREITSSLVLNNRIVDMAGETSFSVLASLLEYAGLLLTNDSAPLHLALAMGCPVVGLFGPSRSRALLPPSGEYIALKADISCAPCYDNEPFGTCIRHDCIMSLSVETVWKALCEGWERWSKTYV